VDAKHGDGDCNGKFEVIAGSGKGYRSILVIRDAHRFVDKEADEKHEDKVDDQGNGYFEHI